MADRDAEAVRRLARAGALVVGISNAPEGGLWMETDNDIYGRTNNPWNLRHTAGGSSGGERAIVAAAGVAFGLGADVGGSIRIPAAFCGCVGHKPIGRMIPNTGFFPHPTARALPPVGQPGQPANATSEVLARISSPCACRRPRDGDLQGLRSIIPIMPASA